jgi:hypothetical protein
MRRRARAREGPVFRKCDLVDHAPIAAPQPTRGDQLSPLIAADPLCGRGRLIPPDGVEERVGLLLDEDHAAVDGLQKRFVDHVVKEVQQAVVESLRVKERAGLGVAAELPPRPDLEDLLQSADALASLVGPPI